METRQGQLQRRTYHSPAPSSEVLLNLRPRQTEGSSGGTVPLVQRDWRQMAIDPPERSARVQTKLTVGAPNDVYEQEADRVADQVMSMPDSAIQQPVQREAMPEEEEVQTKPLSAGITPLVQREVAPEEEEVQTKLATGAIQREEMPEEEEIQTKSLGSIQREEMPEEQEVQTKALQRSVDGSMQAGESVESQLSSSKGGGSPLPEDVRTFMEPRFGADFSQVLVHTGSEAVQMNRDLNAQAFTHKQDVYFGAGKAPGKDVLTAHELTHVVQQESDLVFDKSSEPQQLVSQENEVLQASIVGSIVGGVVGGVAGFIAGGPLGAVAGAVVGAGVGDSLTRQNRALEEFEIKYAKEIFLDSLDYSVITITRNSAAATAAPARTIGNTIHMNDNQFVGNTMKLAQDKDKNGLETLIHEMAHVWQYQHNGWSYAPEALWAQFKSWARTGSNSEAYNWERLDASKVPWEKWNPEAQAQAVEDYNKAFRAANENKATPKNYQNLAKLKQYVERMAGGPLPRTNK